MKTRQLMMLAAVAVLAAGLVMFGGCKKKEQPVAAPKAATPAKAPSTEDMTKKATTAAKEVEKTATSAAADANKAVTAAAVEIEQTMCPVTGDKIDKNIFVEYKGKKVYFCMESCKTAFEKDPEKYIAKLPQFAK
jgi:YHS domain-containing protein